MYIELSIIFHSGEKRTRAFVQNQIYFEALSSFAGVLVGSVKAFIYSVMNV